MNGTEELASQADKAFLTGTVMQANDETLSQYLHGISNRHVNNDGLRHREIIRGITINHLLLKHHIDGLNQRNETTQNLVLLLGGISLVALVVQIGVALLLRP